MSFPLIIIFNLCLFFWLLSLICLFNYSAKKETRSKFVLLSLSLILCGYPCIFVLDVLEAKFSSSSCKVYPRKMSWSGDQVAKGARSIDWISDFIVHRIRTQRLETRNIFDPLQLIEHKKMPLTIPFKIKWSNSNTWKMNHALKIWVIKL